MLVQNGVNVTANASYNADFDSDPKQSNTGTAMRSFAAILNNGRLVLGTASATFPQIADDLIARGAVSALSLDGGASSMLYTGNSGFLTSAGRELASALVIVLRDSAETKPETPEIPVVDNNPNTPSSWAAASIEEARGLNLIPSWMLYGYRSPITRSEFCALLIQLIPARTGKTADQMRTAWGSGATSSTPSSSLTRTFTTFGWPLLWELSAATQTVPSIRTARSPASRPLPCCNGPRICWGQFNRHKA